MKALIVRISFSLIIAFGTTAPTATFAQGTPVFDYSNFVNMGKQYQQMVTLINSYSQQLTKAKESLLLARQQATALNPAQWQGYESMFKFITAAPQFINSTVEQQKTLLHRFGTIYPEWNKNVAYSQYATDLSNNTKGAAQQLIDSANANDSEFAKEKNNLDSLTQYHPQTQAAQMDVLLFLVRQDIEQMQKLRLLTSSQSSSMGTYYGTLASEQKTTVQKNCEAEIQSAFTIASNMNKDVKESDVRSYYLARNPACSASN